MRSCLPPLLALLVLAGCGDAAPSAEEAPAGRSLYATPPAVLAVAPNPDGGLVLEGRAEPDERVRLIEIDGTAHGVTADAQGRFSLALPAVAPADRLISLNAQRTGRAVSADGWLFSPAAAPERAVMLRPGGASLPVGPAPLLAVVDVDAGGGVAVAGSAAAGQEVEVRLDGASQGRATSGPDGVWSLVLNTPLTPGEHRIQVVTPDARMDRALTTAFVRPASSLESARVDGSVRVGWALPGGGAQTTYILLDEET